ncbi:MAG: NAD(P)/FAD-dependent oxidoreductase [Muribaculaceae bacterium]|nr:NAD(P)/FAD-dependent oxidoreductase [Muribaculaceae bacterium]
MDTHSDKTLGRHRIVVVGGGFAGLNFIKKIDKKRFEVILIDSNNYHSFPPLFYQIASSGLDPSSISFPFRREMRKGSVKGVEYQMGRVSDIDFDRQVVHTQYETISYDSLVIAAGTTNNFFGNDELEKSVYTLKSVSEAIRCRDEILERMERATLTKDKELRKLLLNFTVIGGGPTGVEIAGALGEMKRYILPREYPTISPDELQINLIEGSGKVLGTMSEHSSAKALQYLKKLMVKVRLNTTMTAYNNDTVSLSDGSSFTTGMVIWTAGITARKFDMTGVLPELDKSSRFVVDTSCRVKGVKNVFALGDIALMATQDTPRGYPQLAQVAIQQARHLAKEINTGSYTDFKYKDKGAMATVGRNLAVADLPHLNLSGFFAWLTWMFIHLISILGMRNKLTVLITWIWAYCSYPTSLRLIINPSRYPLKRKIHHQTP